MGAIIALCIVGLVIMTETTGDMLAVGEIVGMRIEARQLADGLRADGLSTMLGGIFTTFPYTAFAQNVGLVSLTEVKSRYVATFAGGVLILLGLLPKLGGIVEGIPLRCWVAPESRCSAWWRPAASGPSAESRSTTPTSWSRRSRSGSGLLPTVPGEPYADFPAAFQIIVDLGISAGAITAILLNLVFNSRAIQRKHGTEEESEYAAHAAVRAAAVDVTMPVPDTGAAPGDDPFADQSRPEPGCGRDARS